jgi:hypothetical protein
MPVPVSTLGFILSSAQEHFERKPLQSPPSNSVILWERGTLRFQELYQIFRAALFLFAAIPFQIFSMNLIVLIFITGA